MSVCLLFVFASLLEFAVVNVFSRKEIRRTRRGEFRKRSVPPPPPQPPSEAISMDDDIALEQV